MIGALRAAVLLGGSSIVAIAMTLVTAKGLAVLVGPHGVGFFALAQSVVDLGVLLAGLGVSVSLVRLVGAALDRNDLEQAAAIRTVAGSLAWSVGIGVAILLILLRGPIAVTVFGSDDRASAVVVAAAALPITLAAVTNVAALSSYKLVAQIATLRTLAVVALAVVTLGAVAVLGEAGAPIGILGSAAVLWIGSRTVLGRAATSSAGLVPGRFKTVAGDLIRFGIPYAASTLAGSGIQMAIPILVAILLDTEAAGFYRAATQISAGYVTFIAAAMLQDYYPRLSREQASPATLVVLIDQQLLLVMVLTFPLILTGIALSNVIVPILYSAAFSPAVAIVGWQLVGTLLRLPSWTLSFAILARGRSRMYFAVELAGGLVLLVGSLVGIEQFGLAGLGGAVLLTYLVYYPLVWLGVRRDLPLGVTAAQKALFGTVGLAVGIQALSLFDLELLRQVLALALAAAWLIAAVALFSRMWLGRHDRTMGIGPDHGRQDQVAEAVASATGAPEKR